MGRPKGSMSASPLLEQQRRLLKDLAALKQLQELSLNRTRVTDAGLKDLAAFKLLQELSLSDTEVTDSGLKDLT